MFITSLFSLFISSPLFHLISPWRLLASSFTYAFFNVFFSPIYYFYSQFYIPFRTYSQFYIPFRTSAVAYFLLSTLQFSFFLVLTFSTLSYIPLSPDYTSTFNFFFSRVVAFVRVSGRLSHRVAFLNFHFSLLPSHHRRRMRIRRRRLLNFAHIFFSSFSQPLSIFGRVWRCRKVWRWQGVQGCGV